MNFLLLRRGLLYENFKVLPYSIDSYLEMLSLENLRTIKSIRNAISKKIGIKRNIPLYISKFILLIRIKVKDDEYYINYFNTIYFSYGIDSLNIIFRDKNSLNLRISHYRYKKICENIKKVCDYISLID